MGEIPHVAPVNPQNHASLEVSQKGSSSEVTEMETSPTSAPTGATARTEQATKLSDEVPDMSPQHNIALPRARSSLGPPGVPKQVEGSKRLAALKWTLLVGHTHRTSHPMPSSRDAPKVCKNSGVRSTEPFGSQGPSWPWNLRS